MTMNTITIKQKFDITNAKSKGFSDHKEGEIPFVTNGIDDNGIIGFVKPLKGERVFNKKAICVSAFCEATVHKPPFLPRGNGGSGLLVLTPIDESMTYEELYYFAAQLNMYKWKFSYGRMVTGDRLRDFIVQDSYTEYSINNILEDLLNVEALEEKIALLPDKKVSTIDALFIVYSC